MRVDYDKDQLAYALANALKERDEAREDLKNHTSSTIHSCHDQCQRTMCVLRRERDEAREERDKIQTELEMWRDGNILHEIHRNELKKVERERDDAREALDCLLAVIGLTRIAGNREALQEAVNQGLVVLRKLEETK